MSQFSLSNLTQNNGNPATDGLAFTNVVQTTRSNTIAVDGQQMADSLVLLGTVDVNTPANKTIISFNTSADTITTSAHGFQTGLAVTLTTTGSLPTGLDVLTTYYVIVVSTGVLQLATTLADALNGVYIDFSGSASGTNTIVVTALANASVALQGSFDGTNWVTVPNQTQTITADASINPFVVDYARFPKYSALVTMDSGRMTISPFQIGWRV